MKNKYGATVTDWGNVDKIGIPVTSRVGGLGVRDDPLSEFMKGSTEIRSDAQRKADRELFLRDPKAYIAKCQGRSS